jgi:hypothetical protein
MYITGIQPNRTTADAEFTLGVLGTTSNGKIYKYIRSDATGFSAGDAVIISEANVGDQATTTTSAPGTGQGLPVGVPEVSFTASYYGWVQVYGACAALNVATSCAAHTNINTTATAGRLDDDATEGAEVIEGLTTTAAESSNSAAAFLNFPIVGRTL